MAIGNFSQLWLLPLEINWWYNSALNYKNINSIINLKSVEHLKKILYRITSIHHLEKAANSVCPKKSFIVSLKMEMAII